MLTNNGMLSGAVQPTQPVKTVKEKTIDAIYPQLALLEDNKTAGYVPKKDGKVIGTSGVTIGMGLDLGAHSKADLTGMGIPTEIVTVLEPYLGLKTDKAVTKLATNPLTLTEEQVKTVNKKVKGDKYDKIKDKFKDRVGRSLEDEDDNVIQAVVLAGFNLGESGLFGKDAYTDEKGVKHAKATTNFAKQLKDKKYTEAATNLKAWNESAVRGLKARRRAEGDLLAGTVEIGNVASTKDTYAETLQIQEAIEEAKKKTEEAKKAEDTKQGKDLSALRELFPLDSAQPMQPSMPMNRRLV
jgi:hypothetical protein